jgi:hypothetical protein
MILLFAILSFFYRMEWLGWNDWNATVSKRGSDVPWDGPAALPQWKQDP